MVVNSAKQLFTKYPLVKGMFAYCITWPTGNIIQQTLDGKRWGNCYFVFTIFFYFIKKTHFCFMSFLIPSSESLKTKDTYDWNKCLRFSLYGSFYVAPTLYAWVRITSKIWPVSNVRTAIMKTVLEQLTYGPAATASFFFIISLMEEKTIEESKQEVCDKFWPTYKVCVHLFVS